MSNVGSLREVYDPSRKIPHHRWQGFVGTERGKDSRCRLDFAIAR